MQHVAETALTGTGVEMDHVFRIRAAKYDLCGRLSISMDPLIKGSPRALAQVMTLYRLPEPAVSNFKHEIRRLSNAVDKHRTR